MMYEDLGADLPTSIPYLNRDAIISFNREILNLVDQKEFEKINEVRRQVCAKLKSINRDWTILFPKTLKALAELIGPPDMTQHRTGPKRRRNDVHYAQAWASVWGREKAHKHKNPAQRTDDIFITNGLSEKRLRSIKARHRALITRVQKLSYKVYTNRVKKLPHK